MEGKFLFFLLAVVAVLPAEALPVEELDDPEILGEEYFKVEPHIFENKILEAINKLKEFLANGDPSSGIPPLDPYFLSYQQFDFFIMDTELKGFFQNTTFAHFSRFQPKNIELNVLPLHFKLDLFLDLLSVSGRYKMSGKILNILRVNGMGKFTSETKNLTLSLYLRPANVNSSLQIKDIIIEFKSLGEKITYTNELIDDTIRTMDENLALYILNQAQAKYGPPLLNMVKSVLNHFLLGYSYADILKIILEFLGKH